MKARSRPIIRALALMGACALAAGCAADQAAAPVTGLASGAMRAHETRRAFVEAVAAGADAAAATRAAEAMALMATIVTRLRAAGNGSALDVARAEAAAGMAEAEGIKARLDAQEARARFARRLGREAQDASVSLPDHLPEAPAKARAAIPPPGLTGPARADAQALIARHAAAYVVARLHATTILPARARIAEETRLRQDAMLVSILDRLDEVARDAAATRAANAALRDFWLADADLDVLDATGQAPMAPAPAGRE